MPVLKFGSVTVDIQDGLTVTTLPDGSQVTAAHEEQEGQAALAAELGYAGAREMNKKHDAIHSLLAHMLELDASPTLKGVASKRYFAGWREEEAAVFALARFAKVAGVDLMEVARRWSDDD